jgi:hypothetical protein
VTEEEMNTCIQSGITTGFAQVITMSPIGLSTGYGDNQNSIKRTKKPNPTNATILRLFKQNNDN